MEEENSDKKEDIKITEKEDIAEENPINTFSILTTNLN